MSVGRWTFPSINANPVAHPASFRRRLLAWYRKHGRDLPWRRTTDPYAILVSELMLQQTQVATVIPYYQMWLRRFPDFSSLAVASEQEVLHAWQGLGYYTRARNLRAAAQTIMNKHGGRFPRSLSAIHDLPGVGRYTANAVATFAFNRTVPIVEANIARLLARLVDLQIPVDSSMGRDALWRCATELLPSRSAGLYNSALMDLGALVCSSRPKCVLCPVRDFCQTRDPARLPLKRMRPSTKRQTEYHGLAVRRGSVLLEQSQNRWRGMWMLPRLAAAGPKSRPLYVSEFAFTNHRITLTVFRRPAVEGSRKSKQRWFRIDRLQSVPLPSPHRRALEMLISAEPHRLYAPVTPT